MFAKITYGNTPSEILVDHLSTGKKAGIIFLSSFLVLITAIAIAIPVTMAVIEDMNTHRPVPGTYVSQDEGATATLVLHEEEDLAGSRKVLRAAALTYVAALAVAVANLIRILAIRGRSD